MVKGYVYTRFCGPVRVEILRQGKINGEQELNVKCLEGTKTGYKEGQTFWAKKRDVYTSIGSTRFGLYYNGKPDLSSVPVLTETEALDIHITSRGILLR